MKVLVCIAALLTLVCAAHADLDFTKKRFATSVSPSDESFIATFTFENTGDRPVEIRKVDSNCGCLRAETDKQVYAKGESGKVTAEYSIGSVEGKQTKQIWVVYAEKQPEVVRPKVVAPAEDRYEGATSAAADADSVAPVLAETATDRLTVEVDIPVVITIEPKITKWDLGSEPTPRKVKVTLHQDSVTQIEKLVSSEENITVESQEITPGKQYELTLTPKSTEKLQLGMITIHTNSELARHAKREAFFAIERVKAPPAKVAPQVPAKEPVDPEGDEVDEEDSATLVSEEVGEAEVSSAPDHGETSY